IETIAVRERELHECEGHWCLMLVRTYRTTDNRIDGAVVAFLDIDPVKKSLEQASQARYYAEMLVETIRESLIVLDEKLRVTTANHAFYVTFQTTSLRTEGKTLDELAGWAWARTALRPALQRVAESNERIENLEVAVEIENLGKRTLLVHARQLQLPGDVRPSVLLALEDITMRKAAENRLRDSERRLRNIFESSRDGIWILDAETGSILEINSALTEMLDYTRAELIDKKPWEVALYADPALARERFERLKEVGNSFDSD